MNNEIFYGINLDSYDLKGEDFIMAMFLIAYLDTISLDEAKSILGKIFPAERSKDNDQVVSIPELTAFIKEAQKVLRKNFQDWDQNKSDICTGEIMSRIRHFVCEDLNVEKYLASVPFDMIDMLHDCYKATEASARIHQSS